MSRNPEWLNTLKAQAKALQLVENSQKLNQCKTGYMKLPIVPKVVCTKGAVEYYINNNGRKIYLNKRQKALRQANKLSGVTEVVPQPSSRGQQPLFQRVQQYL